MPAVVVPARAGVLSAAGLVGAPVQVDLVRSWHPDLDDADIAAALDELARRAGPAAEVVTSVDCRYAGQSHEMTVPTVEDFPAEHERRNGYARPGGRVEVVALRVSARTPSPRRLEDLPVPAGRRPARGPAVLAEEDCTVWVPDGWVAEVGGGGAWILRRSRS
jgi:N-methylhydantoinase A/oxoprolinase/acetone carboxylase beta subunit